MNHWVPIASIVVAAVGSGAVVGALIYASRQTQALQGQVELESEQAADGMRTQRAAIDLDLMGHVLALNRLFFDAPDLRPYFFDGVPAPTEEPARSRVLATAMFIVNLADAVASMVRHGQLAPGAVAAWMAALGEWGRSPVVQEVIASDDASGAWDQHTLDLLNGAPIPAEVRW
jgi:hypothetical protein